MLKSSRASHTSGLIQDWEVWIFPGACVHTPLWSSTTNAEAQYIGTLGDNDPTSCGIHGEGIDSIHTYCNMNPGEWWHVYAGHSRTYHTQDGEYMAVDFFYQPPQMAFTQKYIWYILMDCFEPNLWYKARIAWIEGCRDFAGQ